METVAEDDDEEELSLSEKVRLLGYGDSFGGDAGQSSSGTSSKQVHLQMVHIPTSLHDIHNKVAESFLLDHPFMTKVMGSVGIPEGKEHIPFEEFLEQLGKSGSDKRYMWA
ncbi:hypothetical protein BRADI_4g36131v3 [Brachypodium distachyon]|uniref:Uncharacterized protein n=1 Tax=Brachypodium distachyon TaxID=15368 RepID=A0A2K2CSK4_BRADI|nr:hypothetical protein BRADI_4g36131v3 [Brachypodium distachyon]